MSEYCAMCGQTISVLQRGVLRRHKGRSDDHCPGSLVTPDQSKALAETRDKAGESWEQAEATVQRLIAKYAWVGGQANTELAAAIQREDELWKIYHAAKRGQTKGLTDNK